MYQVFANSPIGLIHITSTNQNITSVHFVEKKGKSSTDLPECIDKCISQLDEYFKGKRKIFDLSISLDGTSFRKSVWHQLQKIPFGKTVSYSDISDRINKPKAHRAVGSANNRNPISIIVPCHRVISKFGKLSGYAGGLDKKEWLIRHEQSAL